MDTAKKSIQVAMLLPERDKPIEWEETNDARGLKRLTASSHGRPRVPCACVTKPAPVATCFSEISAPPESIAS
jgi:hypothetical protein